MFVDQIVWDHPDDLHGNYSVITASGYTLKDVEEILTNERNDSSYDVDTSLSGFTSGTTSLGKSIRVFWFIECGNPLHIYPVRVVQI